MDVWLVGSDRDEHQDVQAVDATQQVREPTQRRAIAPVQIIDDQREGLPLGQVHRQPVQAVQHREAGLLAGGRSRRDQGIGREERRRQAGQATEQLLAVVCWRSGDGRLEQLADDPIGELPLKLTAPGSQYPHLSFLGSLAGHGKQARLANPGRALDDHQTAATPAGSVDRLIERLQLGLAFQQLPLQGQAASS
ncbi:MAG TPA: hypothetical protein VHS79_05500 [Actinomycetes bacterium]|nr:hypothetical protein [Actinomycetes bacterium]